MTRIADMRETEFEYSINADLYHSYRPTYPPELYAFIASLVRDRKLAWDCATGSGQAAFGLADFFDKVVATDLIPEQLAHSRKKPNIEYFVSDEENPSLQNGSVDLVSAATAIHWLDNEKFFREAKRVLKPGGIIAVWGYTGVDVNEDLDDCLRHIISTYLRPYYPKQIDIALGRYEEVQFPFEEVEAPAFRTVREMSYDDFVSYVLSWSASQRYTAENKKSPLSLFEDEIQEAWGDCSQSKTLSWELITHFGLNT